MNTKPMTLRQVRGKKHDRLIRRAMKKPFYEVNKRDIAPEVIEAVVATTLMNIGGADVYEITTAMQAIHQRKHGRENMYFIVSDVRKILLRLFRMGMVTKDRGTYWVPDHMIQE